MIRNNCQFGFNTILFLVFLGAIINGVKSCTIPAVLRGSWFSWEDGRNTITEISAEKIEGRGRCRSIEYDLNVNYTLVLQDDNCYHCVKLVVRTVNVLQKVEKECINLPLEEEPTVERVCQGLNPQLPLQTLFSENYTPVSCRLSLKGVWQFAYQNRFRFTGECNHPDAKIHACQTAGTQFYLANQKFNITYRECPDITNTSNGVVEYSCLGDWFVGDNHFFAAVNPKESLKNKKYRCFLKNQDNDQYIGVSNNAECHVLMTPENSPERLRLTPVEAQIVQPGCRLPSNFYGEWINTANIDADTLINETHITETWTTSKGQTHMAVYVCDEHRDTRYMMTRLSLNGCPSDHVCFDFVPRHHNAIRYRQGTAEVNADFNTVCSSMQFIDKEDWKYDFYLAKNPVAVRCPIAGKFRFTQHGDIPFEAHLETGITLPPRPGTYCRETVSEFSVCGKQQEIAIEANSCVRVDRLGRPVRTFNTPGYRMKCIGYWQENFKSYLITYDEQNSFSKYRCWVYQQTDLHHILMSQSLGSYCDLHQDATSWNYTEGSSVAIDMQEYESERDQCPMHFDDGSNAWVITEL